MYEELISSICKIKVLFFDRLNQNNQQSTRREFELMYRACQVMHIWSMEVFELLVPALLMAVEFVVVVFLFVAIRVGFSNEFAIALFSTLAAMIIFYALASLMLLGTNVTDVTTSTLKVLETGSLTKLEYTIMASCPSLKVKVGSTFTITKDTLSTIFQGVIIDSLINLLVTFK